jgi:hypothetical protein
MSLEAYETIAEGLEEAARREADYLEHAKTPEEDRLPTAEEAEVLADVAGRLLLDWPGLPEMLLWETTRDPSRAVLYRLQRCGSGWLRRLYPIVGEVNGLALVEPSAAGGGDLVIPPVRSPLFC